MSTAGSPVLDTSGGGDLLTVREHGVIRDLGRVWVDLCAVVGDGPSRQADLAEVATHIHALQHAVLAQAAARRYPEHYRLLGDTVGSPEPPAAPADTSSGYRPPPPPKINPTSPITGRRAES